MRGCRAALRASRGILRPENKLATYLNQDLGFDEVRWATMRKTSYDSRASFQGAPSKKLLPSGTRLYRLVNLLNGRFFEGVWWIPKGTFDELHDDANRSQHGGGRLFRNYIAHSGDRAACHRSTCRTSRRGAIRGPAFMRSWCTPIG